MVSEDSDELVPGFLSVHRLSDLSNLDEPTGRQMTARVDHLDHLYELFEVLLLRSSHRMQSEERNDRLQKIVSSTNDVSVQVLAMVVVPPIRDDLSDTEVLTEIVQRRHALCALRHGKLVRDLVSGLVAGSTRAA